MKPLLRSCKQIWPLEAKYKEKSIVYIYKFCKGNVDTISRFVSLFLFLFQLNKPVAQTKTVKCHQLSTAVKDPKAGSKCLVAGWGRTEKRDSSDVLMSAKVTVIDRVMCNSSNYYNHKPVITSDMICAGSNGKKKADTCNVSMNHLMDRAGVFFLLAFSTRSCKYDCSCCRGILEGHCCAITC